MDPRRGPLRHLVGSGERLALAVTLAVAAATRLVRLDLMEFKADEAEACRLALHALGHAEPGVGTFFPTAGLIASVGVPNPPLFPYLLAAPLAVVRSPLAAATFVALANVLGVWLCYVVGRRYYSRFVGLCAAFLLATSPWAIVYSRKIWAQDLLVPLTCLFLLALHSFAVRKRPGAVVWLFVLAAAATQLHFSAWVLAVVVAAALVIARDALSWRWLALGAAAALLLYAPYLWHLAVVGREAAPGAPHTSSPAAPSIVHRFFTSARDTLALSGGDRLSVLLGSQPAFALPLSVLLGGAGFVGLLFAPVRSWGSTAARVQLLLPVWYLLPLAALTMLPVAPFPHYFIVLYPLPFLGLALGLQELAGRWRPAAAAALAVCLGAFLALDGWMLQTVAEAGGAPGDYGAAYRYKADAARSLVHANPSRELLLFAGAHLDEPAPHEYRFLVWNERGATQTPTAPAAHGYLVAESFAGTAPAPAHRRGGQRFGPVEVAPVPLSATAR